MSERSGVRLRPVEGGVLLPVQARPGARRSAVAGVHAGRLKVAVTQPPERGKANAALIQVLAQALGLKKSQIKLSAGATASEKTFLICGLGEAELSQRLVACLETGVEG